MTLAIRTIRFKLISTLLISLISFSSLQAEEISSVLQVKLEIYKIKLVEWSKDPDIIKAVLKANNETAKMNNPCKLLQ